MSEWRAHAPVTVRALSTTDVLDGAVRLVRSDFRTVLVLSAPVAVLRTVLVALLQLAVFDDPGVSLPGSAAEAAIGVLAGTVLTGLLAPVYVGRLTGTDVSARTALSRLGWRLAALVLLGLIMAVVEGAGLLLLVAGGIWLWGVWALAAPAFGVEGLGVFASLRRSFRLVRGDFWRVWGIRALGALLVAVLSFFVTILFDVLAAVLTDTSASDVTKLGHSGLFVVITGVGGLIAGTLLAPVAAGIDVLLYTDRRVRREGMDITMALAGRPRPAPPPIARPPVTSW